MQNIDQIGPQTTELVAHEFVFLLENYPNYFDDFTGWLSGERSFPFELLNNTAICLIF